MSSGPDNRFPVGGESAVLTRAAPGSSAYGHVTDTSDLKWVSHVRIGSAFMSYLQTASQCPRDAAWSDGHVGTAGTGSTTTVTSFSTTESFSEHDFPEWSDIIRERRLSKCRIATRKKFPFHSRRQRVHQVGSLQSSQIGIPAFPLTFDLHDGSDFGLKHRDVSLLVRNVYLSTSTARFLFYAAVFTFSTKVRVSLTFILMFISLVGNLIVFVTMFRNRARKSRVNFLIMHLAVADIVMTLIVMPLDGVWNLTIQWYGGEAACRILMFLKMWALYASTFILVVISIDRCTAILRPLSMTDAYKRCKIMVMLVWVIGGILSIPQLFIFHLVTPAPTFTQCATHGVYNAPWQEPLYNSFHFVMVFILPLAIMITCYLLILAEISRKHRELTGSDYRYSDGFKVTDSVKANFDKHGYIILRSVLDGAEIQKLRRLLEADRGLQTYNYGRDDGEGGRTKLALWHKLGNDITGVVTRVEKVAGTMEKLLGGKVYHYHSKVVMKEARTGGAHIWHQDYGYWYVNGFMFPDMGTVLIAVDKADKQNGCLKILPGSHRAGRIDHVRIGDQAGADRERVAQLEKSLGLKYVELEPGDAIFFHCNLLHRSDQNRSDRRRWAFLIAYNRADNLPVCEQYTPEDTTLEKLPNTAILECPSVMDSAGRDFFKLENDFAVRVLDKDVKP
uniref:G-protein coupled receptors family 1 profile domain-containing protein n=1 Tax=Branchiostoma floridae TaxID=7739 RepID=C3YBI3_BRAFL|eukprot:XP_002606330.1 hypothetical protein BRAFLDRAFT_67572 [Branchiostoma floridae]